ncbi:HNH endonuclease [Streptococcus pneumoniae]
MIDVSTRESRNKFYHSREWRKTRKMVLERDHFECQWCKEEGKVTTERDSVLEVDHIEELEYHPDKALDIDNLRTLCHECHNKRHNRPNKREKHFREDEWWG